MRRPAMIGFRFWAIHKLRWWGRKPQPCVICRRPIAPDDECGTFKNERTDFGDGSWVEWRSWVPCSPDRPGGVVPVPARLLDEEADLGDLEGDLNAVVPAVDYAKIAANGGYYGEAS